MKLRLWGWLRQLSGYPRLTVPYAGGAWITLDERDWLQREVLLTGTYEPEVWDALASHAAAAEILWDVGAHIGVVALRAVTDPRFAEIHAFEPAPVTREILLRHADMNAGGVRVHPWALGDCRERRRLRPGPASNTGLSSLAVAGADAVDVECVTADELVFEGGGLPSPTLLKIDVEGWEGRVLAGAARLLRERPPRMIVIEAAARPCGAMAEPEIEVDLRALGYRVGRLVRPEGRILDRENYVAVHDRAGPPGIPGPAWARAADGFLAAAGSRQS
jgi:FkbM family methyltransferase